MWQVSVILAEREIGMQPPKIRRRWLVEGFDIHLIVSMPIDLVDLYDVLYASLHDGLEVHRTCCLPLCTTDFQSVEGVIDRRDGLEVYCICCVALCMTDF